MEGLCKSQQSPIKALNVYFGSDERNACNGSCIPFLDVSLFLLGCLFMFLLHFRSQIFFLYKNIFYIFPYEMLCNGHCECGILLPEMTGPFTYVHIKII